MANPTHTIADLYADHHGWLHGWLRRKLGCHHKAEDVTQDAFVQVMTAGVAKDLLEPRAFLVTVARHLVAHRYRRQLLEESYLQMLAAMPEDEAPSPEAHYLALEALRRVDKALDGLPPPVKEAFLLCHLEDMSYAEIAARLKVSSSSVKKYLMRANKQCLFAIG